MLPLVLPLLLLAQDLQLFPQVPGGWQTERIEFPLSFAPEIELEGFEELLFAPGMFEPESDTYWTYALGIHVRGTHAIDAAWLTDFLHGYYRGLCGAVAEGREFEVDVDAIHAHVAPGAHGYVATVELFDSFTTGAPFELHLEFSIHPGFDSTDILGLASARPRGTSAWTELDALGRTGRGGRPTELYFNHLFLVPDADTYAAIAAEPFLTRELGVFEQRTTKRTDIAYTGLYFYGPNTYFEFLAPDASIGFGRGATGVAFGLESAGGTQRISDLLGAAGVRTFAAPRTRALGEEQVPWFTLLGLEQPTVTSSLSLFSVEYDPGFLRAWHPELSPASDGLSRRAVLDRYAAKLGSAGGALGDVIEVRLSLDDEERARFLEVATTFGYAVHPASGDATVVASPGVRYVVSESKEPGGVNGFVTALRRELAPRTVRAGKLEVVVDTDTVTFTLQP